MIQFNYTGTPYPSIREQQDSKAAFLEKLGPFTNEFDEKGGIVTFNYSFGPSDMNRTAFSLGKSKDDAELGNFIGRWNEHIRSLYGDVR
jgi:hypothetical protein